MSNLAGENLMEARLRSGLEPQMIASRIHITTQQYLALERGEYHRLRGDVFVRGYLRTCAAILGIDAATLLQQYVDDTGHQQKTIENTAQMLKRVGTRPIGTSWHINPWLILLLCLVIAVAFIAQHELMQEKKTAEPVTAAVADAPPVTVADEGVVQPSPEITTEIETAQPIAPDATVPVASAVPVEAAVPETGKPLLAQGEARLFVLFKEECWVKVLDRDKELFQGTKARESSLEIIGKPPFDIMFGNVAAVSKVEMDGQVISVVPEHGKNKLHMQIPSIQPGVSR